MSLIYQYFGFLAAKTGERLLGLLQPYLNKENITIKQLGILILIDEQPGITQKQIGLIQQIDRTTVTQQIDLLEQMKLVKRNTSACDRRAYALDLTAKGRNMAARLRGYIQSTEKVFFENLSEAQVSEVKKLLFLLVDGNCAEG
jgi:DNA-binding MarR family transcriptional regulator